MDIDSETAFFNYVNAITAERTYLLQDAHPEWKHKARVAGLTNPDHANMSLIYRGKEITVAQWFSQLSETENAWIRRARETELPEFESTVLEFQHLSEMESMSEMSTATPSERSFSDDDVWSSNKPVQTMDTREASGTAKQTLRDGSLHGVRSEGIQEALETL